MPVLSRERIAEIVAPYLVRVPARAVVDERLYAGLESYLALLVRWNGRMNLSAVREPAEMVRRHFGESVFAGCRLGEIVGAGAEVLDLGSGAGFPGVPIQLLLPSVRVVLAESQGKKVAFLREVVRTLGLGCEVFGGRVESMEAGRYFDAVTMRAVDKMEAMVGVGLSRVRAGGVLLEMTGVEGGGEVFAMPERSGSFVRVHRVG